ncbi:XdhC family protein [Pseudaminobacter sp. 19-2017]|uniref:XdhC family protein n=1 Tax=Pseudaminobacter soli (ex Zhang et al. 2022) TaxID=2831468 RepID=A0A942DWL9_9HYPH|nr:XdhC family protein [Pseudaminobacter soli]MBS3648481.1 XdhC family protein [Pseudaminobacter soli]
MKRPDGTWDTFDDYVLDFAIERMRARERVAIVTLVEIEGSSPRPLGAQMAVSETGAWTGYLSGGCIERAVAAEAVDAIASGRCRRVRYGRGSRYIDISLPCGSAIELVFDIDVSLRQLEQIDQRLLNRYEAVLNVPLGGPDMDGGGNEKALFARLYRPRRRLAVFGIGPVPVQLTRIAVAAGFEVVVHTPDELTASGARDAGAVIGSLDGMAGVDDRSAIVFAFHDHDREERLLPAALATDAFYIGAMGSRATQATRLERLEKQGFGRRELERIQGPAGLLPHARSASDLAISIMAEVVEAARSAGEGDHASHRTRMASWPRQPGTDESSAEARL